MFWSPKGAAMRNVIESFWKEIHIARGYSLLYTPHIAKVDLWKTSGHYDFYGENMYDQMQVCTHRLATTKVLHILHLHLKNYPIAPKLTSWFDGALSMLTASGHAIEAACAVNVAAAPSALTCTPISHSPVALTATILRR